jgi:pimeloyl-ACP methyl ester carboxylesterase
VRYEGSIQPGFQEAFSAMFPEPRQRWVEAMTTPAEDLRTRDHRARGVAGREAPGLPVQTSLRLMELLPNADLAIFSRCGHWSMIERTSDFNRLVRDFFLVD